MDAHDVRAKYQISAGGSISCTGAWVIWAVVMGGCGCGGVGVGVM